MGQYKIGLYASGVGAMKDICTLLFEGKEPISVFTEYTDVVGITLDGTNVEAGFPKVAWTWTELTQLDFNALLVFANQHVYIRTRTNAGTSGFVWQNYEGYANRVTGEIGDDKTLLRTDVSLEIIALVAV